MTSGRNKKNVSEDASSLLSAASRQNETEHDRVSVRIGRLPCRIGSLMLSGDVDIAQARFHRIDRHHTRLSKSGMLSAPETRQHFYRAIDTSSRETSGSVLRSLGARLDAQEAVISELLREITKLKQAAESAAQ